MDKKTLENLYLVKKLSSTEIALKFDCSATKINYWLSFYKIQKRTISDAVYQKNNPKGDPFSFRPPKTPDQVFLFGLGLGLFWGEGSKRNVHAVRFANSDPEMVKKFVDFLVKIYHINRAKLRFQLLTYDDLNPGDLVAFWARYLSVKNTQFFKTTLLKKRGKGTYITKMKHGVILVHFGNMKLRNLILSQIANIEYL